MSKLLKFLMAFALPMYIAEGGGGGHAEALNTDTFAEMLDNANEPEQLDENPDSQDDGAAQEPDDEAAQTDPDADQAAADPAPDEQPTKDSPDVAFEMEINGEKVAVSREEAKNGYLRQQDYTQKAQNLARERQEGQAHIQQQFAQVQQFSAELGQLTNLDAQVAEYKNVDWQALRANDPQSYSIHLAEFNDLRARRGEVAQAVGQKQQALTQQAEQARQQAFMQQTQEAQAYLAQKIPGFGKEHLTQMKEFGTKTGFAPAELANVADKRMLEVLWKASEYDKTQATTKAEVKQAIRKVSALPTKASKPAPAAKATADVDIDKQRARVRQGGNARDFAALLGMTPRK